MHNTKTRQLALNAVLAAMCAALGYLSLDFGNLKITFESVPILIGALLFGGLDGAAIGAVGTLIYQLLRYGITVTTPLWILPYVLCGLVAGLYARRHDFDLSVKQLAFITFATGIMIFLLNTLVLYIDSKIYGYYSAVFIFGSLPLRAAIALGKAAAFTAVLPLLLKAARRGLGGKG